MDNDVTVCIPSIPPRIDMLLPRTMRSWYAQWYPVSAISIAFDVDKQGAGPTRNRAMLGAQTEWIALSDDDDEVDPDHLDILVREALEHEADVVWPWFRVQDGGDPFPMNRGRQWSIDTPHSFPITTLVRRSFWYESGVRFREPLIGTQYGGEDFTFWQELSRAGARFWHVDRETWTWHHRTSNTSGRPDRW